MSGFTGETTDAAIIGRPSWPSVGLGFVNEYRAERAAAALHAQIHHETGRPGGRQRDGRRRRAGARRHRGAADRRRGTGRPPAARRRPAGVRRGGADRRVDAGGQDERSRSPGRRGRAAACALMGTIVHAGRRPRRGRGDRRPRRSARSPPGSANASRDRVPGRAAPVLAATRAGRGRADGVHLRDQRRAAPAAARRVAVLPRDRGRHHAAAAAGDRGDQPRRRVSGAGRRKVLVKRLVRSRTSATSRCCSPTRPGP